jgi:hypothetical protein
MVSCFAVSRIGNTHGSGGGRYSGSTGEIRAIREGDRHRQRAASRIDILNDLIIGEPGRSGMVIAKPDDRMISGRAGHDQIAQKTKLVRASHLRPSAAQYGHELSSPRITWTWRNLAGEAAWVIQPDWPGCPFPHVMNPYRRRKDRSATPSQLFQNSGVIPW